MDENMLILLLILFLGLIIVFIIIHRDETITKKVRENSERIKRVYEINSRARFYHIERTVYECSQYYDNKSTFNKVEPAYLMTYEISNNLAWFETECYRIKENIRLYNIYINEINSIPLTLTESKCIELNIKYSTFINKEKTLIQQMLLHPVTDIIYNVSTYYSSPQKQINLTKKASFHFPQIYSCLDSIARKYLSKETHKQLAIVERGYVTDSLRYDILRRDNFRCVLCGSSAKEGARLHVDHIIPIAQGGKSDSSNLRTLCERCNIGKSDKIE